MTKEDFLFLLGDEPDTEEGFVDGMMFAGGGLPKGCIAQFDLGQGDWKDTTGQYSLSHSGVTITGNEGIFSGGSSYIIIPYGLGYNNRGFEITFGTAAWAGSGHGRLFTSNQYGSYNSGLIYRNGSTWQYYDTAVGWTGYPAVGSLANSVFRVDVDNNQKWKVYKNGEQLAGNPTMNMGNNRGFCIGDGGEGQAWFRLGVKRIRVYDLDEV